MAELPSASLRPAPKRGLLALAGPLLAGRGAATVLGFVLPLILTRLLPQSEFGTYKQVWLIATTAMFMLQMGLSQSLYYFVPRKDGRGRAWYGQALFAVTLFGALGSLGVYLARFVIARQFGNAELAAFGLPMALIAFTLVASSPLEAELTALGEVKLAGAVIFGSDAFRVAASVVPLVMGLGLHGFFWAYVLHGFARCAACVWLVFRAGGFELDRALFKRQLLYALPFGAAILFETPQKTFHQWAVGWAVDPALFAIYAQGCFQLPLVNLLYQPISDVLQVRLAQPGGKEAAVKLFQDANLRLAAVFFPFTAMMVAVAPLLVPALFTHRYDASIPIFRIAVLATPLSAVPVDAMLRAQGQNRFFFWMGAVRLAITVPCVLVGLKLFGMPGAILGHVAAEAVGRMLLLNRVRQNVGSRWRWFMPWKQLVPVTLASGIAAAPVLAVARLSVAEARPLLALMLACTAYGLVYLLALAILPGRGGPVARVRHAIFGEHDEPAPAPAALSQAA